MPRPSVERSPRGAGASVRAELPCRRGVVTSGPCFSTVGSTRAVCWKARRRAPTAGVERCVAVRRPLEVEQWRGGSTGPLDWTLPALRTRGYALVRLTKEEHAVVETLYAKCRDFYGRPTPYKEAFKFYPVPGGYMTPFPGSHEIFELRRGLPRCPEELAFGAMPAFRLFERLALESCRALGRDLGCDYADLVGEETPTMRCIHYDRPYESAGDADAPAPPSAALAPGAGVRLVGFGGASEAGAAALNGAKANVVRWDERNDGAVVELDVPQVVLDACEGKREMFVPRTNLRALVRYPGMYPAHTDSSLVTIMPRSTASGLEAKDFRTGEWFSAEDVMASDECILFVGDAIDYAAAHRYPALMHRPAVSRNGVAATPDGTPLHRISAPFFLYPKASAKLTPKGLPAMIFDDMNGNVGGCRDTFPWKRRSCYYSDMVYSQDAPEGAG